MYKCFLKRFLDIVFSSILLIVFAIPMCIIAIIIKIDSPGPVFFKQERIGYKGKTYKIIKFRTMCVDAEHTGSGVYSGKGDTRVTRVGRFLRLGIDEIPQCLNILMGSMSFIGPRPPLTYHPWPLEEYTEEQKKMFDVRPGITGWAQVNGRKTVEWNKRIEMNVWYVNHVSILLDLKIVALTVIQLFKNSDNENTGATVVNEEAKENQEKTAIK